MSLINSHLQHAVKLKGRGRIKLTKNSFSPGSYSTAIPKSSTNVQKHSYIQAAEEDFLEKYALGVLPKIITISPKL